MKDYDEMIAAYEVDIPAYEVDTRFPDVSGMEHLEMLLTRSRIAQAEANLTVEQHSRLSEADRCLLQHAAAFYQSIRRVADLAA